MSIKTATIRVQRGSKTFIFDPRDTATAHEKRDFTNHKAAEKGYRYQRKIERDLEALTKKS